MLLPSLAQVSESISGSVVPLAMFHQMMSHQLFANISQQVALLTLVAVANWAPKWHKMHWFKIWLSGGATCNPYPILYHKLQI